MGEFPNAVVDGAGATTTARRELWSRMGAGIVVAGAAAAAGFQVRWIFSLPLLPFPPPLSTGHSSLLSPRAAQSFSRALLFPSHLFRPAVSALANLMPWERLLPRGDAIREEAMVNTAPRFKNHSDRQGDALITLTALLLE